MCQFAKFFTILLGLWILPWQAQAILGACGERPLPSDKVRKLDRGSIRLECSSSADHFVRMPQTYKTNRSYQEWAGKQNAIERQLYRLDPETHPDIKWSGVIGYQTIEKWTWVDWVYGPDPVCGYDTIKSCTTDSNGRESCTETRVMRSCWHDETQYESRFCSTERLAYKASMSRPRVVNGRPPADWNPSILNSGDPVKSYYDVIPNKYDLLPGEVEVYQTKSNSGMSRSITPALEIGDAWNKYSSKINFEDGRRSIPCEYYQIHDIVHNFEVVVDTHHRIKKPSPNAFTLPSGGIDQALRRSLISSAKEDGEVAYEPQFLKLIDSSHAVIGTMSRQSREMTAQAELAKAELGLGQNETSKDVAEANRSTGFFQDTQLKVRLEEVTNYLSFNRSPTKPIKLPGSEVAYADVYELRVDHPDLPKKDLYRSKGPFEGLFGGFYDLFRVRLTKNTKYRIWLSMYQRNVPFYNQEEDCKGLFKGESCYFSKELPIEFETGPNDERTFKQKVFDCWSASLTRKGVCFKW